MPAQLVTGAAIARVKEHRHLGWILLLAVVVRLVYLGEQGATSVLFYQPLLDEQELSTTAKMLLEQHTFGNEPLFKAPLYPVLLAGVMATTGKYWFWAIRLVQLFAGVLLVGLAWGAARRICPLPSKRLIAADIAGVAVALYGPLIRLENCINLDALAVVFQSSMVYCLVRACNVARRRRAAWILAAGTLAAVSWLNRPTITPVLFLLAGWLIFALRTWRGMVLLVVPTLLAMCVVGLRNYFVSGEGLIMPWQGGYAFYEANRPGAHGRYLQQREFANSETGNPTHRLAVEGYQLAVKNGQAEAPGTGKFYQGVNRFWFRRSIAEIRADPLRWLRSFLARGRDVTSTKEIYSYEEYDVQRELSFVLRLLPINFGWLFPFALASVTVLPLRGRRGRPVQLVMIYALGMAAAISIYYTSGRLRMPLVFPVVVLAAVGAVEASHLIRQRAAKATWYLVLFVAGAVLSWGDWNRVRSDDHRAAEYARLSNAAFRDGRPELALQYVQTAVRLDPNYPTLRLLRGQALYALNRGAEARQEFEASQRVLARDPVAPFNLGALLYYDTSETTSAKAALRESLFRDPGYSRAAALLSLLELADGNTSAARQVLEPFQPGIKADAAAQLLTAAAALACATGDGARATELMDLIRTKRDAAAYRQAITDMARARQGSCIPVQPNS